MNKACLLLCIVLFFHPNLRAQNEYTVESALSEKETISYLRIDLKEANDRIDPRILQFKKLERILLVVENQNELDLSVIEDTPITSLGIQLYACELINIISENELSNLTSFSINNRDEESSASFSVLEKTKNLESLGLWKMGLTELPDPIYEMKDLKYLYLTGNRINSFQGQIGQLSKLEELELGDISDMDFLGNPVDGKGIAPLAQLPNLNMLKIMGCDNLFLEDFIAQLKQADLFIYFTKDQCRNKTTFKKYSNRPYGFRSQTRTETGVKKVFSKKLIIYGTEPNKGS